MAYIAPGATVSTPADGSVTTAKLATGLNVNLASGSVSAPSATFLGSTTTGLFSPATDNFGITTAGVERLRILSTGSVGIGTSSPGYALHVSGINATTSTVQITTSATSDAAVRTTTSLGTFAFGTGIGSATKCWNVYDIDNSVERLRIDSSGRVGIGTTSPGSPLEVSGGAIRSTDTAGNARSRIEVFTNGQSNNQVTLGQGFGAPTDNIGYLYNRANASLVLGTNDQERLRIDSSGRVGIGTSSLNKLLQVGDRLGVTQGCIEIATDNGSNPNDYTFLQFAQSGNTNALSLSTYRYVSGGSWYNDLRFNTGAVGSSSTKMTLTAGGSLGIGTSSPTSKLDLVDTAADPVLSIRAGSTFSPILYFEAAGVNAGAIKYDRASQALTFSNNSSSTERLRIDSSGNVGIGTTSPGYKLTVQSDSTDTSFSTPYNNYGIIIRNDNQTNNNYSGFSFNTKDSVGSDNTVAAIAAQCTSHTSGATNGTLAFFTTGSAALVERMRIDSTGLITAGSGGINGMQALLLNSGQVNTSGALLTLRTANDLSGGYFQAMRNAANTIIGTISESGTTAVAYNTTSDYRLKENIEPVADGITRLQQLKPSRFNFITDPDRTVDGFIAHEVQAVVPEAITGEKDAEDDDGNPIYQGIDQSKLVPLLTAALQEAIAKIETLEAKVAALEAA